MENAAKALLIAGGILLALLIIIVAVYFYNNSASLNDRFNQRAREKEIQAFNVNFTQYQNYDSNKRKIPFGIQDVVSMISFANEYNKKNGYVSGDDEYVSVSVYAYLIEIQENPIWKEMTNEEIPQLIEDNLEEKFIFRYPIRYQDGKVSKVTLCLTDSAYTDDTRFYGE